MQILSFDTLLRGDEGPAFEKNVGRASSKNIDKTACFYHVITKSFTGASIFYRDIASYRATLLCQQCDEKGMKIIFSVTMNNHTHDVFLTPSWETLVDVLRVVDRNVSLMLRKKYPDRFPKNRKVLRRYPAYIPVRDIVQLFCLGKYIYDNPAYLPNGVKDAPYSCFWMFESGHFVAGYDKTIYEKLFGMKPLEILETYRTMDSKAVSRFAIHTFSDWTQEQTRLVFYKKGNPS